MMFDTKWFGKLNKGSENENILSIQLSLNLAAGERTCLPLKVWEEL